MEGLCLNQEIRTCNQCGHIKIYNQHHWVCKPCSRIKRQKRYAKNREEVLNKVKEDYKKNPDRSRNARYKRDYGITLDDYNNILISQGNCCAICGGPPTSGRKHFSIDHDHDTGKVRGLLCARCNTGLGMLKDAAEVCDLAIEYLDKYRKTE